MDSQEKKTKGPGLTDELDLEPLDLDFDLELPSLDEESPGDQEFALPEIPEIPDLEEPLAGIEEAQEMGLPEGDEEGPITLTADELNDIVSADLMGSSGDPAGTQAGAQEESEEVPSDAAGEDFGDLAIPGFDESDLAFSSEPDLFEGGGFDLEAGTMGTEELDLDPGSIDDEMLDLPLPEGMESFQDEAIPSVSDFDIDVPPEPIDIDLDLEHEAILSQALSGGAGASAFEDDSLSADTTDFSFDPAGSASGEEDLVSLSEDELDSILGDMDEDMSEEGIEEGEHEGELPADLQDFPEEELETGMSPLTEPADEPSDMDLLPSTSILDADEDESITLTPDELSNIVSSEARPPEEEPEIEEPEQTDFGGVPSSEISFFHDETEEGPVALTDSELADIMEGTTIEEEEPQPASPPRAERMADELSMETGLKRDELKRIIGYLDDLLGQLPEDTVREFSRSEYFSLYKKVIEDLGIYQ